MKGFISSSYDQLSACWTRDRVRPTWAQKQTVSHSLVEQLGQDDWRPEGPGTGWTGWREELQRPEFWSVPPDAARSRGHLWCWWCPSPPWQDLARRDNTSTCQVRSKKPWSKLATIHAHPSTTTRDAIVSSKSMFLCFYRDLWSFLVSTTWEKNIHGSVSMNQEPRPQVWDTESFLSSHHGCS